MISFTNRASLSYNGITKNSNTVSGNIVETLSVTKTAVDTDYSVGDTVTYVINLVNSGSTAYTGLVLTDNLGSTSNGSLTVYPLNYVSGTLKYFVNGAVQAAPAVTASQPLTISGISVPAGGNTTLVYNAQTNEYTPADTEAEITNTVTVTGDGIAESLTASSTVNAASGVNLSIIKSVSPSEVAENGQLTYTFTIENYGNKAAEASDSVIVTDTFNPILSALSVTFNGNTWTEGTNYTYNETTGEFATTAGQILIPKATFTQNESTGIWTVVPGTAVLTVTGTV